MRIAYVINSFGVGGAEKQIVSLAKEHHKRGNIVLIIRLKSQPDELLSQVDFCEVRSLNMSDIFGLASCFFRYKKILDEFNPDVVHSHLPHSIVFSRFLKLLTRKKHKLVCTAHNYNIRTKLFGFIYKHTDFISDFNTNVSQSAVDRYIRKGIFSPEKSSYVPNGFYIRSNRELSIYQREEILDEIGFHESNYVCCAVGRLDAQKNYPMMLEAFKYAVERDRSYRLIIMGGGPDEDELKDLSYKLGISDYVVFLGVVDDVYKYLSVSDLYLMSSVFEGMPLAICEAMIARKPMVVTNFKGVNEFVKDYYPIIEQNDSDKFGECMLEFKNLNLDSTIERARKDIIDHYSIDNVVNQWIQIYDK